MTTNLSTVVRSSMKEEKICSFTVKNGARLNLLRIGSEFLAFPVYLIRLNRREMYTSYNKVEALTYFRGLVYSQCSELNELF